MLTVLALVLSSFLAYGPEEYVVEDAKGGGKKLIEYNGDSGELVIPDELNITEIGDSVFTGSNITKVKSNTVKKIGFKAFFGTSIVEVDFPNAEMIGGYAFSDCSSLKSVDFPQVKIIEKFAFYDCSFLESVRFPATLKIEECVFAGCSRLESVYFPSVKIIGFSAFSGCENLSSFLGNPNVTAIGVNAFTTYNDSRIPLSFDVETYLGFKVVSTTYGHEYAKIEVG